MPYLAVDLDAMEKIPDVADALSVPAGTVCWGLMKMWRHAWRESEDRVTYTQLQGFFPNIPLDAAGRALTAFGFLDDEQAGIGVPEMSWRIRGAERYLRVQEARSKGGKAAIGNLKRGKSKPGTAPAQPEGQPEDQPEDGAGYLPGLTASSEQRAATIEQQNTSGLPSAEPPQLELVAQEPEKPSPFVELRNAMVAAFTHIRQAKYVFKPSDAKALKRLLDSGLPVVEILSRWRTALNGYGFQRSDSIANFESKINTYGPTDAKKPVDVTRGTVPAESQTHLYRGEGEF